MRNVPPAPFSRFKRSLLISSPSVFQSLRFLPDVKVPAISLRNYALPRALRLPHAFPFGRARSEYHTTIHLHTVIDTEHLPR